MSSRRKIKERRSEFSELNRIKKETFAKYFFDLSKLAFGALVLGVGGMLLNHINEVSGFSDVAILTWYILTIGLVCSIIFAILGYYLLTFDIR